MFDWVGGFTFLHWNGINEMGSSGYGIYCVQHVLGPQDLVDFDERL